MEKRFLKLTDAMENVLNRLINRILIVESKKIDGIKTQEVQIVYNFVREL